MSELMEEFFETETKESFKIENDNSAEWAMVKIKEINAEANRFKMVCETFIHEYTSKLNKSNEKAANDRKYFEGLLEEYSQNVKMKETKSQATYKLPSGTIKRKFGTLEFIQDETPLVAWCKENAPTLVKVKESADWAELKKQIKVNADGKVIDENGMVVDGVIAGKRQDTFVIEVE